MTCTLSRLQSKARNSMDLLFSIQTEVSTVSASLKDYNIPAYLTFFGEMDFIVVQW